MGQWKNYDELEEELTLSELTTTYEALVEREERDRKFHAVLAGAEVKEEKPDEDKEPTLADRLRERNGDSTVGQRANVFDGVGHVVIGS